MTAPADTAVATRAEEPTLTPFQVIERVIGSGDLSRMQPEDRVAFYWRVCESTGLNPLTRPFEFISLNGKLTLYTKKDATDQLRKLHGVTVARLERERTDDLMIVTAHGTTSDGREDSAIGAVAIKGLAGEALANALMKAETKAKRRLTLSLVGLGFLDESEIDGAERVDVDPATGEIAKPAPKPATLLDAVHAQAERLRTEPEADVAPQPDAQDADVDVVEGEAVELTDPEPAGRAPMASQAFVAFLEEHRISTDYAKTAAGRLFPGVRSLSDEQRGVLAAELVKED
jgi:hypothetical protein